MAAFKKLGFAWSLFIISAMLFGSNWLCAQYWGFPYLWCWGRPVVQPIVQPWLFLMNMAALGYFCICALKGEALKIAGALMVCILVFGLPTFTEIVFGLGKTCPSGIVPTMSMPMFGGVP